ncbi:hypothetical protein QCA50_007288 [Cerrena zonata]|uniref:Uncharacterized protein n=1 Tax=Cerrena zonata TaxID=2478898 RepID=A0AAW0G817_9APHY
MFTTTTVPSTPRRSQPIKSLSELKYTPPTPPRTSTRSTSRKQSTLRRTSRVSAAPRALKAFILKASGKAAKKPKIIHFCNGQRIPIDQPPCDVDSFDFALLELGEAQQREEIVYRMAHQK